jgi:hypothetical protein
MDVITTVLNQLFDEDDAEHYVGNYDALHSNKLNTHVSQLLIEPNTNNILRNMNTRTKYITRKNIGRFFANNTQQKGGIRKTYKK